MAISGTFVADFSSFQAAVDQSVAKLVDFSAGSDRVQASLNKMVDSFSGVKVIQQATLMTQAIADLGGATTLTASEQGKVNDVVEAGIAKYAALGQQAPQAMLDLAAATEKSSGGFLAGIPLVDGFVAALSAQKILEFGESLLSTASQIENLSRATGLSTTAVQQFGYVGAGFGVTMDEMARGVSDLSTKLINGNNGAVGAIGYLGLSVKDLLAEGPAQAFSDVAEALSRVQDPMQQSALGADLFGSKLALILLPALKDLPASIAAVPALALISDDNTKRAAAFDTALGHIATTAKAITFAGISSWLDALASVPNAVLAQVNSDRLLEDAQTALNDSTTKLSATMMSVPTDTVAAGVLDMVNSTLKWTTTTQGADAWVKSLRDGLISLTSTQQDQILAAQAFGKSQTDIASKLGISVQAVQDYEEADKEATAADQQLHDQQVKSIETSTLQSQKLWDDYYANIAATSGTSFDKQQAAIDKWADNLIATMSKAGADTNEFYDALAADWDAKSNAITADFTAVQAASFKSLTDNVTKAQLTLNAAVAASDPAPAIQHFRDLLDAAVAALHPIDQGTQQVTASFDAMNAKILGVRTSFQGWNDDVMGVTASVNKAKSAGDVMASGLTAGMDNVAGATNTADFSVTKLGADLLKVIQPGLTEQITSVNFADAIMSEVTGVLGSGGFITGGQNTLNLGQAEALAQEGYSFADIVAILTGQLKNPGPPPASDRIPGFASGVLSAPGGWSMVGEQGPEAMYVPRGATILPSGAGPGTTIVQNIYITQPLGTPTAIAQAVGSATMARQRALGVRSPKGF